MPKFATFLFRCSAAQFFERVNEKADRVTTARRFRSDV
jgi:hypothetical protein